MMMKRILLLLQLLTVLSPGGVISQTDKQSSIKIGFYNVENLFDPEDDSLKNDDSFTPEGFNHWTNKKLNRKINNIAKVILAMGCGEPPAILAMAEVENREVLLKLCKQSPLKKYGYDIVHYESPDKRGIDVALIYRPDIIRITHSEAIPIKFPFDTLSKNRDILFVTARLPNRDSLYLFVNHWTSRYGGFAPTIIKRNYYATVVKRRCDSLLAINQDAAIIIVGDFNDYPTDESMQDILKVKNPDVVGGGGLYNLMLPFLHEENRGTHKREDFWGCLDQIIVSSALLNSDSASNTIHIKDGKAHIFWADFMIEPDEKYGGFKLIRTFSGPRYIGGYADHLPVYIDLNIDYRENINLTPPRSP